MKGENYLTKINKKHKDRLFCFIFGRDENKRWSLDLYNAINNTSYENPDDVNIFTIDDVLYMDMKNDVALIVDDILNVYEQQSTFNPNMPVRELIYVSKLYSKYIKMKNLNIYSRSLIPLPKPKLAVFYNGTKDIEDTVLRLSDSFINSSPDIEPDISVNVKMININYGKNSEVLEKCKILEEYSWLINKIREYSVGTEIEEAVGKTLDEMPEDFALKPFLLMNKAEVCDMCITEYNAAETMRALGEEYYAEGKADGLAEGKAEGLAEGKAEDLERINQMLADGLITEETAKLIIENLSQ